MRKWFPAILVFAAFAVSIAAYRRLPDRVPIHWGMDWQPNGWAGRFFGAFGLPGIMAFLWGVMIVAPSIDPRKTNYTKFTESYAVIYAVILTSMFALHLMSLGIALGYRVPVERILPAILGVLFIGLGNFMPRVRSNWTMGFRTPWALSNDVVWSRTQRLSGYLFVAAGVLFIANAVVPSRAMSIASIGAIVVAAIAPFIYSYVLWSRQ